MLGQECNFLRCHPAWYTIRMYPLKHVQTHADSIYAESLRLTYLGYQTRIFRMFASCSVRPHKSIRSKFSYRITPYATLSMKIELKLLLFLNGL